MEDERLSDLYIRYKSLLFGLAYRLLGNVSDSEDIVHDVYSQLRSKEVHEINIKSLLCTMVTHRCFDLLKSARYNRESYPGTWLPEPIVAPENAPVERLIINEKISMAYMHLLEKLSPEERAVFILREVLDMEYEAIAGILGKANSTCRKIYSRSKKKVALSPEDKHPVPQQQNKDLSLSFIRALNDGDMKSLLYLLSPEVIYYADGGGIVKAAVNPIKSKELVSKLLYGLYSKFLRADDQITITPSIVNGNEGFVIQSGATVFSIVSFEIGNNEIKTIFNILNPNKLTHIKEKDFIIS